MRRRDFIVSIGGVAAWPIGARAQQPAIPVIGWLDAREAAAGSDDVLAFRRGLSEAGFVDGRNVAIVFRWADTHLDRLPAMAAELVRQKVAAILTTNAAARVAMAATSTIPIVFAGGGDPVENGLVTSLNHPGGNVTGVSYIAGTLNTKRFQQLHQLVPAPALIAAMFDSNSRLLAPQIKAVEDAARVLGRKILVLNVGTEAEIDAAFARMEASGVGALLVTTGALFNSRRRQIVALAARYGLPASYHLREFVLAGGLMSYGASTAETERRAGQYVGRILKGEKPGDLPVELPTRYQLVLNLATAKALKLDIPPELLALADEAIE